MTWSTRIHRRGVFVLTMLVLVLALALAGCGGRAARGAGGSNQSQQTQQTQQRQQANPSAQDVIDADNQIQGDLGAMNDAQNAANTDYSAQENEVQP